MTKPNRCIRNSIRYRNLLNIHLISPKISRNYAEDTGKKSGKEEQVDSVKMPGFVHPQTMHDEGYFTQKAKQQLEELKKRMDKPTVDNPEKKE